MNSVVLCLFCYSVFYYFTGFIRDSTGSYNIPFYVIGSGMIIAAIALFCEPWFKRLEEKRVKGRTVTNGNDVPDINISDETK